ncbi:MAG: TRAP transporter large permease subunit, partial [Pseudomonadota bacterium]
QVVAWFMEQFSSPTEFLVTSNLFLLMVGTVMDIGSAVLILAPMLAPVAAAQGIDAVHFGIVMIVNLEIGYLTPPFGLNLIVAMGAFKEDFWTICKAVVPFLLIMLTGLVLVTFIPRISLFLLG